MMVVLSLSMVTFLAWPRSSSVDVLELDAEVFADAPAAGQDGDVLEHRLAAIAEAGRLDGGDVQRAAQLVHDQRRQRFAFDILGDDQQRLAHLGDLLEHGRRSFIELIFFSWIRISGFSSTASIRSGSVTK